MARPKKWRRVEFFPETRHFIPTGIPEKSMDENILKVEELEALRLKDLEGMDQQACAEKMNVSRQTFQRILNSARIKTADSLVNGKAIIIRGGNFTKNICNIVCRDCGNTWKDSYENYQKVFTGEYQCPECNSTNITCCMGRRDSFCRKRCRHRGNMQP